MPKPKSKLQRYIASLPDWSEEEKLAAARRAAEAAATSDLESVGHRTTRAREYAALMRATAEWDRGALPPGVPSGRLRMGKAAQAAQADVDEAAGQAMSSFERWRRAIAHQRLR